MLFSQRRLDARLLLKQPIERGINLALSDVFQAARLGQTRCRRFGLERAPEGKLGPGRDDAIDDQCPHDRGRALLLFRARFEQRIKAGFAHRAEHRGDMTVRQCPADLESVCNRSGKFGALDQLADRRNHRLWQLRDVSERTLPDRLPFAKALANEDGRRRGSVWHTFDEHGRHHELIWAAAQVHYMDTFMVPKSRKSLAQSGLSSKPK